MKYIVWQIKDKYGYMSDKPYYSYINSQPNINEAYKLMELIYRIKNDKFGEKYELEVRYWDK